MIRSAVTGLLAAAVVTSILYLQDQAPGTFFNACAILMTTLLAAFVQWYFIERPHLRSAPRSYHGLSDMLVQIHSPSTPDTPSRWTWKGFVSFLLSCVSGSAGPEGSASELNYAIEMKSRPRSARWFEQKRRTDAASVLAASIAAAFGAPFAAVLVPIELGIGGRTLSSVICALTAYFGIRFSSSLLGFKPLDVGSALDAVDLGISGGWLALVLVALLSGLMGAAFLQFVRFSRKGIASFAPRKVSLRILSGGILLFFVSLIYPLGTFPSQDLLQDLFVSRIPASEAGILLFSKWLALSLVIVGFGTVGVFWPVFALGGFFGFAIHHLISLSSAYDWFPSLAGFGPMSALAGAAAFWAAILGTPVAGAVLILEMTNQIQVALPCLVVGIVANAIARKISRPLPDQDLQAKGIQLVDGRAVSILEGLFVGDMMARDFETIHEQETLGSLPAKLLASRYPFLPVVRGDGIYTGLVTIDMVQDQLDQDPHLFEVKDLLYRSGFKAKQVKASDSLNVTHGMFQDIPCVPVIGDDGRIEGLLFVHHVRLAYEREVARRSLRTVSTARSSSEAAEPEML